MLTEFANPEKFERIARIAGPAATVAALACAATGLYFGLVASPPDYQQGDTVRIMYVHVPAAWLALFAYVFIAGASVVGFAWKHPLADVAAKSAAPIGAVFTALALITGSIWGKPMWGAWWAWDARLTSMLILFFLYLGYIAVWEAFEDKGRAARIAAIVATVGVVNVPIIHFSVDHWSSLHQKASVFRSDGPTIDPAMLTPLLIMAAAYMAGFVGLLIASMRNEIAARRLARIEAARPVSEVLLQ